MKNFSWRLIIVAVVITAAMIYLTPTIRPGWWPYKTINLGLDLQGGMHLVLEVETEKAVENSVERISLDMRSLLKKERVRHTGLTRVDGRTFSVRIPDAETLEKFDSMLTEEFAG